MERSESHIGKMIADTAHIIKHRMNSYMDQPQLNGVQVRILAYIKHADRRGKDVFRGDIEQEFKISRPSVTSVLNTMEKNGYVRRVPVPKDARLKKLTLTDKAIEAERQMYKKVEEFEQLISSGLDKDEVSQLQKILDKILKNIEEIKRC